MTGLALFRKQEVSNPFSTRTLHGPLFHTNATR